jgi:hypothetical protein
MSKIYNPNHNVSHSFEKNIYSYKSPRELNEKGDSLKVPSVS